jgi:uncharacterized membrane protein
MDPRPALHQLAVQHTISPAAVARLHQLADLDPEPAHLNRTVPLGVAILGAALGGLGIVFWIAANWDSLGRMAKFSLLQSVVLILCGAALWLGRARMPLCIAALLAIGGLFAYFGQTYQTGADPWQLFALWAALTLPLCLGVRHDAVWTPWTLVAISAISLWIHAHAGNPWRAEPADVGIHLAGWSMVLLVIFALSPVLRRHTGAGAWALRTALTFGVIVVMVTATIALFSGSGVVPHYWLGLAMMAGAAAAFCSPRLHDTFALSAVGLGLNVLVLGGMARWLFEGSRSDIILDLLLIGVLAAAALAATVKLILAQARKHATGDAA